MRKSAIDPIRLVDFGVNGLSIYGRKATSLYIINKLNKIFKIKEELDYDSSNNIINKESNMNKVAYLEGYLMKQYTGMDKKAGWWDSVTGAVGDAAGAVGGAVGDAAGAVGNALTPTKEIPLSEQLRAKNAASPQYDYKAGKARLAKLMANIPAERSMYQQKNRDSNYTPGQQKATNDSVNAFNKKFGVTQPTASNSQADKDYWAAKGIKY